MKPSPSSWRWFFMLAALEAGAAFLQIIFIPRDQPGFSFARLAMLALLGAFLILGTSAAFHPPDVLNVLIHPVSILVAGILSLILAVTLFLLRYLDPVHLLAYYQRLSPLLWYFLALGMQTSAFLLIVRYGLHRENLLQRRPVYLSGLIAFCVLTGVYIFTAATRLGLTPDTAYWGELGVPILGWQLGLAILSGILCILLPAAWRNPARLWAIVIPVLIWLLAAVIWLSVPLSVMQNSFYAPIDPPAHQPYPYSDAGYYDSMAESLTIGYPYQGDIPTRPLYIAVLAGLHWLVGERYDLIIAGQTLLLALIPVVFYLLGQRLHSRTAGVIIALLAIFREWTSLLISSQTRVSNTKTLLVDLPTLLLTELACLFALRWMAHRNLQNALAAGGLFGILCLLRTQSLLIVPMLFLIVILAGSPRIRIWAPSLAWFIAGFVVAAAPWLVHNYLHTGQLTFDAPFQYQIIASQYKYTGNLDIANVDLQGKSLFGILLTFVLHDPKFVLGFIATHFFATQISGLLALPLIEPYAGLLAPINLYWLKWDGNLSWLNVTLVFVYLAIISVGLGAAWRRLRWAGLIPLAFALGYSLANGVSRFSGWRYDLPADWISYFYFGIGAAEILGGVAVLLGMNHETISPPVAMEPSAAPNRSQILLLAGVLAIVGAIPWIAEGLAAPRYTDQTTVSLVTRLSTAPAVQSLGLSQAQVEAFTAQPQATLQIGRVLYPRYFGRNAGLASAHPWPAYAPRDFPRLGFLLLNQTRQDALLPTREIPDPFPQAADAIVLGCRRSDYIKVRLILFPDLDVAFLSAPLVEPCN